MPIVSDNCNKLHYSARYPNSVRDTHIPIPLLVAAITKSDNSLLLESKLSSS